MNNEIICYVNLFTKNQKLVYPGGQEIYIPIEEIPSVAVKTCYALGIEKIHFITESRYYIEGIIDDIYDEETLKYSNKKIKVEVN